MAEELVIRCVDKDHYWINGRQFVSLKRAGEMLKEKRRTNGDKIRAMSDEDLAMWLDNLVEHCNEGPCFNCFLQEACGGDMLGWVKQEEPCGL